jgi:hypothetical protein
MAISQWKHTGNGLSMNVYADPIQTSNKVLLTEETKSSGTITTSPHIVVSQSLYAHTLVVQNIHTPMSSIATTQKYHRTVQ